MAGRAHDSVREQKSNTAACDGPYPVLRRTDVRRRQNTAPQFIEQFVAANEIRNGISSAIRRQMIKVCSELRHIPSRSLNGV
jgi:hypothetical protein